MEKITIEFNMYEDRESFEESYYGSRAFSVIRSMLEEIRRLEKSGEENIELDILRTKIVSYLEEYEIINKI